MHSLENFPRIELAHLPTPLEPLRRLSDALGGPSIWVKRDDATGLALGGNKTRKLEFLLAAARAEGADWIITAGGVQSNHVRQTAAAAARMGLECTLVLNRNVPNVDPVYDQTGNLQLDYLLGADVQVHPAGSDRDILMLQEAERLRVQGRRPYIIPVGGSNSVGSLGYVAAAVELVSQLKQHGIERAHLIHACSSGGTHAGLAVGIAAIDSELTLHGIDIEGNPELEEDVLKPLTAATATFAGIDEDKALQRVRLVGGYGGGGYGVPSEPMGEAIFMVARKEGLLLDPVYSGKAMAGLIDLIIKKRFKKEETVIFLHTGGSPALFAYPAVCTTY